MLYKQLYLRLTRNIKEITMTKKSTTKTSSKTASKGTSEKKQRKARPANDNFRVSDPGELIQANPEKTQELIEAINKDKKLKRSELYSVHNRIAYRLALIGVLAADTLARNATERTYKLKGKLSMATIKAAIAKAQ